MKEQRNTQTIKDVDNTTNNTAHATRITQHGTRNTQLCVVCRVLCVMCYVLCSFSVVYSDCKIKNKKQDTEEINTDRCIIIFRNLNFSFRFFLLSEFYLINLIMNELKKL